jgi:hypothetical protein
MRFYYARRILYGTILGIYFGEKRLPFPIQYMPKQKELGDIKLDLSFVNSILADCRKMLPTSIQ